VTLGVAGLIGAIGAVIGLSPVTTASGASAGCGAGAVDGVGSGVTGVVDACVPASAASVSRRACDARVGTGRPAEGTASSGCSGGLSAALAAASACARSTVARSFSYDSRISDVAASSSRSSSCMRSTASLVAGAVGLKVFSDASTPACSSLPRRV